MRYLIKPLQTVAVVLLGLHAVSCSQVEPARNDKGNHKQFTFTTDAVFDPGSIPAYAGNHAAIYQHIDDNIEAHVGHLQRWVRQPSISAQDIGIRDMGNMLRDDLAGLGFSEAEVVETAGHPGVWGYYDAGAKHTLAVYLMYDVQPVNPEDWQVSPFAGELVDNDLGTVLLARGATNQKGPERAFLNAIGSIIAVTGGLPVNLMVLAEGEEELGSPNYPELVDRYEDRLKTATGVFFPFNSQSPTGRLRMSLGVKGIVYFELEARGGAWGGPTRSEIHGSYKALVDAPALRLVQAIASLTSSDGNTILIPEYTSGVRAPTVEEQRLINGVMRNWDANEPGLQALLGVERWAGGVTGRDAIINYLYNVTLNVDGLWSGYTGEGVKTILPHVATAKVDSRLPPDVDPDRCLALLRAHLDVNGFEEIVIRKLSGYPAAQTSVDAALVRAAIGVFNKWRTTDEVWPRLAGSAPFYQFTKRLGLPLVFNGLGHGSGAHAPNEYMVIQPAPGSGVAGLAEIEKSYVDLLFALGEAGD